MKIQGGADMIYVCDNPIFDALFILFLLASPYIVVRYIIWCFKTSFNELARRRRVKEIERDIEELKKSFH
jgi:hypothetical protein